MIARSSNLVRWTEEADAEEMRATAALSRAPQEVAACRLTLAPGRCHQHHRPSPFFWLMRWLAGAHPQITRDERR